MFVRVIQHAHASVSSFKFIFVCLKCNKMHLKWLIKYFLFFLSERLFLPLFWRSKQRNNLLNPRPLLIPPFWNFTAGKSPAYDFKDIPLTNRTVGIVGSPWLVQIKMHTPYLTIFRRTAWPVKKDTEVFVYVRAIADRWFLFGLCGADLRL